MLTGVTPISEEQQEDIRRNRFFRLVVVLDELPILLNVLETPEPSASFMAVLLRLTGQDVEACATSFLWCSVHLAYDSLAKGEPPQAEVVRLLLSHLFDSFYPMLPDGSDLTLPVSSMGYLALPTLRIFLTEAADSCVLSRNSGTEVKLHCDTRVLTLRCSQQIDGKARVWELPDGSHVLTTAAGLLLDRSAIDTVAQLTEGELSSFVEQLTQGLNFIEAADSELRATIARNIKWYWPITSPDKRLVHNSFSLSALQGGIFLSDHYQYLVLAEALVHEYFHNELSALMTLAPHVTQPDPPDLYSPWRPDPRPIFGIYHGSYVFAGLLNYYARAEAQLGLSRFHRYCRSRRIYIYFQLRTALAQISDSRLEAKGRSTVEDMAEILDFHGEDLALSAAPIPAEQAVHWRTWTSAHPEFAMNASRPQMTEEQIVVA